jgi:hypothetical protein
MAGERRRAGAPNQAAKTIGASMWTEIEASWPGAGPVAKTQPKAVDQSELARLKRERQRLEDERNERLDKEMKIQARLDELETEQHQQSWDEGDDTDDEYVDDEVDVAGIFEADDEVEAEPAAEFNEQTKAAIDAMSPDQRAMFLGGAG